MEFIKSTGSYNMDNGQLKDRLYLSFQVPHLNLEETKQPTEKKGKLLHAQVSQEQP